MKHDIFQTTLYLMALTAANHSLATPLTLSSLNDMDASALFDFSTMPIDPCLLEENGSV